MTTGYLVVEGKMTAILGAIVKFRVADVACVVTNKYDIVLNLLEKHRLSI